MAGPRFSFLHISDLHILEDEVRRQHGADTGAILRQAVPLMNALRPEFIVASGDLISDESEESYRRLRGLLQSVEGMRSAGNTARTRGPSCGRRFP